MANQGPPKISPLYRCVQVHVQVCFNLFVTW